MVTYSPTRRFQLRGKFYHLAVVSLGSVGTPSIRETMGFWMEKAADTKVYRYVKYAVKYQKKRERHLNCLEESVRK